MWFFCVSFFLRVSAQHVYPSPITWKDAGVLPVSAKGKGNFGYDAKSETYVDLLKEGIIDPKKVTRIALENAASVAGMILTTACTLVDIKEDTPAMPPMGGGGGMPGMM